METVIVALISGGVTLAGVLASNSRSRAVMEQKIDELTRRVEKHNCQVERTYLLERDVAPLRTTSRTSGGRRMVMNEFLTGNERWRLVRTVAQGVLGVVVANLDLLVGTVALALEWRALVVALAMAVPPPVMTEVGKHANADGAAEGGDAK